MRSVARMLGALLILGACDGAVARAEQTILYVNNAVLLPGDGASWGNAHKYLQDALLQAAALTAGGHEVQVWVAEGTYRPDQSAANPAGTMDADATFALVDGVGVFGGFSGGEQDFGQRDPESNEVVLTGFFIPAVGPGTAHVVTATGVGPTALLDGVAVTNPSPTGPGGRAIRVSQGSPMIRNSVIRDNRTMGGHSGAGVDVSGGLPVFEGCQFRQNHASAPGGGGGGVNAFNADVILRRCVFDGNSADGAGGGVAGGGAATIIEDCTFLQNVTGDGDGAALSLGPGVIVRRCVFDRNQAQWTAGAVRGGAMLEGCAFYGNTCGFGAGAASDADLYVNCLFSGNQGSVAGGVLAFGESTLINCVFSSHPGCDLRVQSGGAVVVRNTIFYKASGARPSETDHIRVDGGGSAAVGFCFLQGKGPLYTGSGNLGGSPAADPRLADPPGPDGVPGTPDDDLRLMSGSPCIDAGNNASIPPGVTVDLVGLPRRIDDIGMPDAGASSAPVVDMGPHEFKGVSCFADFSHDGYSDGIDYDRFYNLYASGDPGADVNRDGFVDGMDADLFRYAFETGCSN